MIELLRTNDLILVGFVESLLKGADIIHFVADAHVSAVEGSIGAFPRRLMVAQEDEAEARRILVDAGLSAELRAARP
ncbi:putative signal transducing protein [Chelatococcus reniformis]|uniref:DUF2007 domain-containing protein n=1 Tax=Chelatococcus reniformis TaxID=1494448 RepID=A0A916U8K1_9HYPH|nr:DUF2007 domain-containing protein [Chelatococcus reniformis]GGC62572.1 hypothetical protein GCM10010994_21460 [Chelatococcus reniformis]